jgi:GntR family transcriptional regulator, transcriptional repressor for pyruvate dehydrogenase complex
VSKTKRVRQVRLEPIPRTTLTQALFKRLVGHVVTGDWKEGERIPAERELSERLGIGRASLREALKALELMGMLDSRVGDGTFVRARSEFLSQPLMWALSGTQHSELEALMEARMVLEEKLAALAAERATAEEVRRISAAIEDMRTHLDDPAEALEADMRFHVAVAEAAHNQILLNAVQMLRNLIKPWLLLKHRIRTGTSSSLEEHERVCAAIILRDPARAYAEMANHLLKSGATMLELIDRQGLTVP